MVRRRLSHMSSGDIERMETKLFALNLRIAEVRATVASAQARVTHLEEELQNCRLASLLGEEAGDPSEIRPKLETARTELTEHEQLLRRIRTSQWETRLKYLL